VGYQKLAGRGAGVGVKEAQRPALVVPYGTEGCDAQIA